MKKLFNLMFLAILSVCFVSCDKDQSSFDISSVPFKATIKGKVTATVADVYNVTTGVAGVQKENAIQKRVFIEISNSSLDPNGNANGFTIYETVTDSEGNYSYELPTVHNGANVTVRAEDYEGTYQALSKDLYGNPIITTDINGNLMATYSSMNVVYHTTPANKTLKPNDIQICDLNYNKR